MSAMLLFFLELVGWNQEGIVNFDDTLWETNYFMARGDFDMEISVEKIFLAQKMMIYKCNLAGEPVVTAIVGTIHSNCPLV